jgi:putative peptidoglycan lipid II flippase
VISESAPPTAPHRLARAATIVMLFFVASRALGLLRDVVISHQFGTARALDAYFAAFAVPDFVFNVLAGGALGSAFIPTFSAALAQNDARRAWQLARAIVALVFITLTALCALLAIFAHELVALTVARGFAPSEQALTADLMRWMLVTPIIFGVSGIVMGILNSQQHFVLPALAPVVYNVAIIAGALWLAPTLGIYGLVVGVVAGAMLHLAIQVPLVVHCGFRSSNFKFQIFDLQSAISNLQSPDVREVIRLMLPRTLGIAAVQINFLVNTMLASTLPVGAIAALAYAWRVMLLPVGVIGQSLATAAFPTFAAQVARDERDALRATFSTAFRATLFLTIPATAGLIVLGAPFVTLLFQRGQFDARSTAETTFALQFFALALFAHSGLEIVSRAFYALHDTFTPVAVGIGAMGLNIALSLALLAPLAHGGLALANSIATILEMTTLLVLLRRRIGDVDAPRLARSTARIVLATLAMTLVLAPFAHHFASAPIFAALGGALIGAVVYFIVALVLRSEELAFVLRRFGRRSAVSGQRK